MNNNRCDACGAIIPEGRQVCPKCETKPKREYIQEKTCPICNKRFVPAPMHIYKIKYGKLVCSYKCRCLFEKREGANE